MDTKCEDTETEGKDYSGKTRKIVHIGKMSEERARLLQLSQQKLEESVHAHLQALAIEREITAVKEAETLVYPLYDPGTITIKPSPDEYFLIAEAAQLRHETVERYAAKILVYASGIVINTRRQRKSKTVPESDV